MNFLPSILDPCFMGWFVISPILPLPLTLIASSAPTGKFRNSCLFSHLTSFFLNSSASAGGGGGSVIFVMR